MHEVLVVTDISNKETEDPPPISLDDQIPVEADAIKKMKITDLKEELKKRGQPLLGNKVALVERLHSALANIISVSNGNNPKPKKSDKSKSGGTTKKYPDTAKWRVLKPKNETVDEPNNTTFKNPCAPTIKE